MYIYIYIIDKDGEGYNISIRVSKCVFCLIDYILSVTMLLCHDTGNVFSLFCCTYIHQYCILEINKKQYKGIQFISILPY